MKSGFKLTVAALVGGCLLAAAGLVFMSMYVFGAVIERWGEPDQSLLFCQEMDWLIDHRGVKALRELHDDVNVFETLLATVGDAYLVKSFPPLEKAFRALDRDGDSLLHRRGRRHRKICSDG